MMSYVGNVIYGAMLCVAAAAAGKAAYTLYRVGKENKPIELHWNPRKQIYC